MNFTRALFFFVSVVSLLLYRPLPLLAVTPRKLPISELTKEFEKWFVPLATTLVSKIKGKKVGNNADIAEKLSILLDQISLRDLPQTIKMQSSKHTRPDAAFAYYQLQQNLMDFRRFCDMAVVELLALKESEAAKDILPDIHHLWDQEPFYALRFADEVLGNVVKD